MHLPYIKFHLSGFKVNGGTFYNSEEYTQVDLATLYNNGITIAKIMVTKILCEITMHGNNVKGFIHKSGNMMEPGMLLYFTFKQIWAE